MREVETVTLHFDLSHLRHLPAHQQVFTLKALGKHKALKRHDESTRRQHARHNKALAQLSGGQLARLTHYAEQVTIPADAVGFHWVGYPSHRPAAVLDEIAVVFQTVPSAAVRRAVRAMQRDGELSVPAGLRHFGVTAVADDVESLHVDASVTVNHKATALALIMQHPEISTLVPELHQRIKELVQAEAEASFTDLWMYLSNNPDSWYRDDVVRNPNDGTIMEPASDLTDINGDPVEWPTKTVDGRKVGVIPQFNLSAQLDDALRPVVQDVVRLIKQKPWLKGQQWATQQGVTQLSRTNVAPNQTPRVAASAGAPAQADWTVVSKTSMYRLDLLQDSIKFDASSNTLSFNVKNWANRGLGAYAQFLDVNGQPIPDPKGVSKHYLGLIGPCAPFYGIPVWANEVPISFEVPPSATGANVLFGGLGYGSRDKDVDEEGRIYTCCVSFGIPSLLCVLSVGVQSTQWYTDFLSSPELLDRLIFVALPIFIGAFVVGNETLGPEQTLIKCGQFVAGILLNKALKALALKITGYVTTQQLMQNAPFAGWALRVASLTCALANMTATSVEVALSPAVYQLQAKRSMTLNVSVSPDPTHGTQKPIWPKGGDHYVIDVQYKGGTTLTKTGPMPDQKDAPITVTYSKATNDALPSAPGQQFQIVAHVYAANDWLCGKWVSGWIEALPTDGDVRSEAGSIIEELVALVPGTQYKHDGKLQYDGPAGTYVWEKAKGVPTSGTTASLNKQDVGELVDLTINNLAYRLGYCYRARNQNLPLDYRQENQSSSMYMLKSISTLAKPGDGMQAPTRGFSIQPSIAFDQFGPASLFTVESSTENRGLLNRGGAVPPGIATIFANEGFPLRDGMQVKVVTKDASWQIGAKDRSAAFDLRRQADVIDVFTAPAPAFSPNNFYLDTRTGALAHLRLVNLLHDGGNTFDYDSTRSWGAFGQQNLNALAVHPNGYVIAISYLNHKMEILKLPTSGVPDKDAPQALPFCGKGIPVRREGIPVRVEGAREGLMGGPVAMTICADGRILVLEQTNARIQAFDTQANPVQCFAAALTFGLPAGFGTDLNAARASTALLQELQKNVPVMNTSSQVHDPRYLLTPAFSMTEGFVAALNAGTVTPEVQKQFDDNALPLGEGATILQTMRNVWLLRDSANGVNYDIRFNGEMLGEVDVYRCFAPTIIVKAASSEWLVMDKTNTLSFDVTARGGRDLQWRNMSSVMALKDGPSDKVFYLDVAVENKGFVYVLSYVNEGSKPTDYRLDLYNPDGTPLNPNKGSHNGQVNAARMAVDQWRTLFTLNYEQMQGRAGRPEPTVSQWVP